MAAGAVGVVGEQLGGIGRGLGLAWRPQLAWLIHRHERLRFSEVVAENVDPMRLPPALVQCVQRGRPVIPHGIGLSLGSAEGPEAARLDHLARLAEALDAPFVSEHIAFVRAGGIEAGHLLPIERTPAMFELFVSHYHRARSVLGVPLALENVAALFEWPQNEIAEAQFVADLLRHTGAPLLLDLANLFANSRNHGFDAEQYLDTLPLKQLAYVHVAGGTYRGGLYHDTHAHPLGDECLELLRGLVTRVGAVSVLLERDRNFESRLATERELDRVEVALRTAPCVESSPSNHASSPSPALRVRPAPVARSLRASVGERQARLLRALVGGASPPEGFDAVRLVATRDVLARKHSESYSDVD